MHTCNLVRLLKGPDSGKDIVDWGRKWLVDSSAGKTQLASFDWSNNTNAIDVKMDGTVSEEIFQDAGIDFPF